MTFPDFLKKIDKSRQFQQCLKLAGKGRSFNLTGLGGSSPSLFINSLVGRENKPLIVLLPDYKTLETVQADLEMITRKDVNSFPAYRGLHLDDRPVNKDIRLARLKCLKSLVNGGGGIFLIEARSLLYPVLPPDEFRSSLIEIKKGQEFELDFIVEFLINQGFQRETMVEDFGDISVRGGIVDIFSPDMLEPIRIEFDYDTVESIRVFDINDQRSVRTIEQVTITPPIQDALEAKSYSLMDPESSILKYFSVDIPVFFHQPVLAQKSIGDYIEHWKKETDLFEGLNSDRIKKLFSDLDSFLTSRPSAYIKNTFTSPKKDDVVPFNIRTLPRFNRNLKMFSKYIADIKNELSSLSVGILCDNEAQAERLKNIILDEDLLNTEYFVHVGSLDSGFVYPDGEAVLINDHELFSRKQFRKPKSVYRARKIVLDDLSLKVGDFIVHEDYGIGRYLGLKKIRIGSSEQEALKLSYRDRDTLFLNIEKLPRLEKYSGQEGYQPELSKLGGTDWTRLKQKTKRSVKNITSDLLDIYAKRDSASGFAFSADTQWQREMEASFLYSETPDQLKACWDIKKDMESATPMDRLVCGDVGFGKTEVALRAAFKAVNDGKQVAILVPTTILAQQHHETFRERLVSYPVNIEVLSRFRTRKEQLKIIENVKNGLMDIVIGTHRLLSKDISFRNLGLIIVDEEQRFGVTHKEKLKKLRAEVDVLTLTATPIPRTMHMAVLGVRDLSTISTPPRNRLPIITEISEYDEELIRAGMMKELDRGGQIYFVHNRVQTIQKMVVKLKKAVPEATYGVAHGQMKEKELEQIMLSFLRGDFDCLVSTMIIESGLDIPSVNTIIINQADNFGLAQLYQLRGRVGRSDIQAFAYLLTPPFQKMSDVAISRLQTLSEHTELGAGLQVALKDLEIRGAGNLLGAEQSGHINSVGFDMYTRLVKESVSDQLKEALPESEQHAELRVSDIKLDSDISSFLPENYISDEFQRVSFYRKLADVESTEQLNEFRGELTDRYGPVPDQGENLLRLMEIKLLGSALLMDRINIINNRFTGTFIVDSEASANQKEQLAVLVSSFVQKSSYPFRLIQEDRLKIELPLPESNTTDKLDNIKVFLDSLKRG